MVELSSAILQVMVLEWGTKGIISRLADPFWFQALGCLLGFDWHSSGLTTTTTGAIKEALNKCGSELGLFAAGGKGKTALETPLQLAETCEKTGIEEGEKLIKVSRLTAKIDNNAVQDGYSLYHHVIFFDKEGNWCVVQQGLNPNNNMARRYHWLSESVKSFTEDPHHAVCCDNRGRILNLVASEAKENRKGMLELAKEGERALAEMELVLKMPLHHHIDKLSINLSRFKSVLVHTYERQVISFEELLLTKGVGASFLRALALTSEVVFGKPVSFKDPARFSFAHGGKDGHPYPVNLRIYKHTIEILKEIINKAKIGKTDKLKALRRLSRW
ncbi:conserved hypothetical protein [Thermosulfidibacter takaii ABI70S6]|uniref:DUF763 domain-containing protein n=2 Tax=Thermosulfidibacter takaii TaxID=412593 RepID=A0A0S3QRB0_THET7|nr:conserved hypothetical protein [Thermosulfidibacter takaii ABI70S6]